MGLSCHAQLLGMRTMKVELCVRRSTAWERAGLEGEEVLDVEIEAEFSRFRGLLYKLDLSGRIDNGPRQSLHLHPVG